MALVDVGVAILAALSNICKYKFDVTLGAGDRLMHAAERIFCLVVVEFRNGTDWFPCVGRMAVLAGQAQVSVRTVRDLRGLCPGDTGSPSYCQKKE